MAGTIPTGNPAVTVNAPEILAAPAEIRPVHDGWKSSELAVTTAVGAAVALVPSLSMWQQLALALIGGAYSIARAIAKFRRGRG